MNNSNINSALFDIINSLRGYMEAESYTFILYFLTLLHRERAVQYQDTVTYVFENYIKPEIKQSKKVVLDNPYLQKCHDYFKTQFLEYTTYQNTEDIVEFLHKIDRIRLAFDDKEFYVLFEYLLKSLISNKNGLVILPLELAQFMIDIADIQSNTTVYNPFAGLATFATLLPEDSQYYGQEISIAAHSIGTLRLMAYNDDYTSFKQGDSISNWNTKNGKYDTIIAFPPFNLKNDLLKKAGGVEPFLINNAIESLKDNGKLILLVSENFLYTLRKKYLELREFIIDKDILEMVISLPRGILMSSSVKTSILIINKNKKRKDKVIFINGEEVIGNVSIRKPANYQALLSTVQNITESDFLKIAIVINQEIKKEEYNWSASKFCGSHIIKIREIREKYGNLCKLQEVLTFIKGEFIKNIDTSVPFITSKNLAANPYDNLVVETHEKNTKRQNSSLKLIAQNSLLINRVGYKIKPTWFEYENEPIQTQNIFAFKVNTQKVNKDYLITELFSDLVQKQVEALSKTGTMPFKNRKDILELEIRLPDDLSRQKQIVLERKEDALKLIEEQVKAKKEKIGLEESYNKSMIDIRHTLLQKHEHIAMGIENILGGLQKHGEILDKPFIPNEDVSTFQEIIERLKKNLNDATQYVVKQLIDDSEKIDSIYKTEKINLVGLLQEWKKNLPFKSKVNIEISVNEEFGHTEENKDSQLEELYIIEGNQQSWKSLFTNFLDNADKHGFREPNKKYNFIIKLSHFDDKIQIDILNDGDSLPKEFNIEDLTTKGKIVGETGNTGQGGYFIKQVVTASDGTIEIVEPEEENYSVHFKILIPYI